MRLVSACAAVALAASAACGSLAAATSASAATPTSVPSDEYSKYLTISGPSGLDVGGAPGIWTIAAKNPTTSADTRNRLIFNAFGVRDPKQFTFEVRNGTGGSWQPADVSWYQMSSNPDEPMYNGAIEFAGGGPLGLAAGAEQDFQLRVAQAPSATETYPFDTEFSAYLTPTFGQFGQGGDFTARADTGVSPRGLHTAIQGLPTSIPADGRTRGFKVSITTANHADWHLPSASFFLWQGQKYGSMSGPSACDAEMDVRDPATGGWHRVPLGAVGMNDESVDLTKWATGPAWDRVVQARLTLGAGFRSEGTDAQLGFGYFPGSGDPDWFWTTQKLTSTPVAGAPRCAKPSSGSPSGGGSGAPGGKPGGDPSGSASASPSASASASASSSASAGAGGGGSASASPVADTRPAGGNLARTGGGGAAGPAAGLGAVLVALGAAAVVLARRRGWRPGRQG